MINTRVANYRSSLRIIGDLLENTEEFGQQGINTNTLITRANLSHSKLKKLVENLTGVGLITKGEFDTKNTFVITEKGRKYLESYRKFAGMAESFGLEL